MKIESHDASSFWGHDWKFKGITNGDYMYGCSKCTSIVIGNIPNASYLPH